MKRSSGANEILCAEISGRKSKKSAVVGTQWNHLPIEPTPGNKAHTALMQLCRTNLLHHSLGTTDLVPLPGSQATMVSNQIPLQDFLQGISQQSNCTPVLSLQHSLPSLRAMDVQSNAIAQMMQISRNQMLATQIMMSACESQLHPVHQELQLLKQAAALSVLQQDNRYTGPAVSPSTRSIQQQQHELYQLKKDIQTMNKYHDIDNLASMRNPPSISTSSYGELLALHQQNRTFYTGAGNSVSSQHRDMLGQTMTKQFYQQDEARLAPTIAALSAALQVPSLQVSGAVTGCSMSSTFQHIPLSLPVLLALPNASRDRFRLSEHQFLLRQQIEVFEATDDDITTHTRGRNKPITLGQVGIRCKYCAHVPVSRRQKGSTYFPSNKLGIYQAAQNMSTAHIQCGLCRNMPNNIKLQFTHIMENRNSSASYNGNGAGRPYWAKSASLLGLVDTEDHGIRFVRNLPPDAKILVDKDN